MAKNDDNQNTLVTGKDGKGKDKVEEKEVEREGRVKRGREEGRKRMRGREGR